MKTEPLIFDIMGSFGSVAKLLLVTTKTRKKPYGLKIPPNPIFSFLKNLNSLLGGRGGMKGKEKGDGKRRSLEHQV